jgi:hypothetical protein
LAATDFMVSSSYRKNFMVSAHNEPTEYDNGDAFFAAIGAAIIAWQSVEGEMAHLFSYLLASRAGLAASAVFYHIKNNKTRLEMLDMQRESRSDLRIGEICSPNGKPYRNRWLMQVG